jgi:trans-2,3-dihydro-3-hydroxyanthranilate isomerase
MQALALEFGFSETTFVLPPEEGGTARIRIFTPASELPFAGHPILGTAWVLAAPLQRAILELETPRGIVIGSSLLVERYENGLLHAFVVVDSREAVAALSPDFGALADLEVMVSCIAGSGTAWKSRMFAPADGVPEDAATGSAAGPLACHLCRHGLLEWKTWIEISQGAEIGRPSTLFARAQGSTAAIEQVEVGGRAVIAARGEFRL